MEASNVIAFGSLLVAAIAVCAMLVANSRANANQKEAEKLSRENNKLFQENNKLNERLLRLEEERREDEKRIHQRAQLSLHKKHCSSSSSKLIVVNEGPAKAHEVKVETYTQVSSSSFPVEVLHPNEQAELVYKVFGSAPGDLAAKVVWLHPSGEQGELRTHLNLEL